MSSAAEEEEEAAALETVKSVTLTQDSDGSIILHCPPSGEPYMFIFPYVWFLVKVKLQLSFWLL